MTFCCTGLSGSFPQLDFPLYLRTVPLDLQRQANELVRAEAARMRNVDYIDVFTPMLGADGQPRPELFGEDRLHMNREGYTLWRDIVSPFLR